MNRGLWIPSRHLRFLCEAVEEFIGRAAASYEILVIIMPPQHGKSMSISEALPAWRLLHDPNLRVMLICYNDKLAASFGLKNRRKIDEFGPALGGLATSPSKRGADEWTLANGVGGMISRGIFSGITGRAADLAIIDDPIKNIREAYSPSYRDALWDAWQSSIKTRLSSGAKVIVATTRWHEDDLAGRIIARESSVKVMHLPCEALEGDPLGRKPGQALFPEIGKDEKWMTAVKQSYVHDPGKGGLRAWEALYQGLPSKESGQIVKREWWRFYRCNGNGFTDERLPDEFDQQAQSWDCSFKRTNDSDYVCGGVWGRKGAKFYLLDLVCRRMSFVETIKAIGDMSRKWPGAVLKFIEDKANGSAVIDLLSRRLGGIIAVNPTAGKVARVQIITPMLEAGDVFIPHPDEAAWVAAYINQFDQFPTGAHDDMVDMTSQALYQLSKYAANQNALHGDYSADELRDMLTMKMINAEQLRGYKKDKRGQGNE